MKIIMTIQKWAVGFVLFVAAPIHATNPQPLIGHNASPLVVKFDFAKADLKLGKASEAKCKTLAQELKDYPYAKLEIDGHTDIIGPEAVNQKLSEERAAAVRKHFIERYGITPDRVVIRAFAEKRPATTNDTLEGRRENRRVVARVYRLEPDAVGTDRSNL